MITALIVYASLTGNTEDIVNILAEKLEELDVQVTLKECYDAEPDEFTDYDLCVVGTYTYGVDGELPDEIYDFHEKLADIDLTGKIFGVVGSGEEYYVTFCKAVDDFDKQFELAHAVRGAEPVKIEESPNDRDAEAIGKFAADLVHTFKNR